MTSQSDARQLDIRGRLLTHYEQDGLLERIDAGLAALGENPAEPSLERLSLVDEFHIRGRAATVELIELMNVGQGDRVLDVGSGLGGPARQLAAATGANVTGVDISAKYCALAETLSTRAGLGGRTRFFASDVASLDSQHDAFDAAWSIHVGMNIADKESFYTSIIKRLKPGGRFVVYDVVCEDATRLRYPLPWASARSESFPVGRAALPGHLEDAGFTVTDTRDDTDKARDFLAASIRAASERDTPAPLGLHTVLGPRFREIVSNLMEGFQSGSLGVALVEARKQT